ncbi:MAG: hypothetical protein H0W99_04135 [Acidobacteria bacterium]|nr:hypothetical protein [Acidobacteriota bacterium]
MLIDDTPWGRKKLKRCLTPELTGRTFNESSIQVSRMKGKLTPLRLNELLSGDGRNG